MVSLKTVTAVLFVVNWVHLSSTLSDECLRNLDDGQDLSMIPIEITCATYLNGTLNTQWTVEEHVQLVTLGYNCTGFGEDQVENLHLWAEGSRGEPISDSIDLRPSTTISTDPACYVDGCFVWSSGRGLPVTWIIPTVTCNLSATMVTETSTTYTVTGSTKTTKSSGGLKSYLWLLLLLVPIMATILFAPLL